jgi:hypothetical protein
MVGPFQSLKIRFAGKLLYRAHATQHRYRGVDFMLSSTVAVAFDGRFRTMMLLETWAIEFYLATWQESPFSRLW